MGNDMRTYGAALHLTDPTQEKAAVSVVVAALRQPGVDLIVHVNKGLLAKAATLEELLAVFALVAVRTPEGDLVAVFGADGRYTRPQDLYAALAPAIADRSWVAFASDYDGVFVVTFTAGQAQVLHLGNYEGLQDLDWGLRPQTGPQLTGNRNDDLTTHVAFVSERSDLAPGWAAPAGSTSSRHALQECVAREGTRGTARAAQACCAAAHDVPGRGLGLWSVIEDPV